MKKLILILGLMSSFVFIPITSFSQVVKKHPKIEKMEKVQKDKPMKVKREHSHKSELYHAKADHKSERR